MSLSLLRAIEKFEVSLACDASGSQNVLDDEHREGIVPRNHDGPENARLGKYHVIASFAHQYKTFQLDNTNEFLVRNRNDARHSSRLRRLAASSAIARGRGYAGA